MSVPVANSEIEATNAAAALKVSALTAVSVTNEPKLAVVVTASDPVALSVTVAGRVSATVTTSEPVAVSCTSP